jgi:hypothetical protein
MIFQNDELERISGIKLSWSSSRIWVEVLIKTVNTWFRIAEVRIQHFLVSCRFKVHCYVSSVFSFEPRLCRTFCRQTYGSPTHPTLKMEATYSSETPVDFQLITRRYIPEISTLHNHRCDSLKSFLSIFLISDWHMNAGCMLKCRLEYTRRNFENTSIKREITCS